jgi:hypothetical protein
MTLVHQFVLCSVTGYVYLRQQSCKGNDIYTVEHILSGPCLSKKSWPSDALNCAETLLEFLEQESDSNFGDILTLRKLRTSIKLKTSKKTKYFLTEFFMKDNLTVVRTTKGKNSYLYSFLK